MSKAVTRTDIAGPLRSTWVTMLLYHIAHRPPPSMHHSAVPVRGVCLEDWGLAELYGAGVGRLQGASLQPQTVRRRWLIIPNGNKIAYISGVIPYPTTVQNCTLTSSSTIPARTVHSFPSTGLPFLGRSEKLFKHDRVTISASCRLSRSVIISHR